MKKKYKHIFFDLDNTLWDFDRNSAETLNELYLKYDLAKHGIKSSKEFIARYNIRNTIMWEDYRLGKIDKDTLRNKRFAFTFSDMGLDVNSIPQKLADDYVASSPHKNILFPDAEDVLAYLHKKYLLHIITNGFPETQDIKLIAADIKKYFGEIITSEGSGFRKPDVKIFLHAMELSNAIAEECLMIGDGLEVDIIGARNAGWDAIYFNPKNIPHKEKVTHEIKLLSELKEIL
jgi:putative hydrolase of the HAD superfamily